MKINLPKSSTKTFQQFILLFFFCLSFTSLYGQISLNMELRANWDDNTISAISGVVFNDIWGYVDEDSREYAILGSTQYTHFIDITDPENPVEVERIGGNSGSLWRDFKTYNHYAYGVADQGSATLQIFDLSDLPNSVTKVYDSSAFFAQSHNIFIDEPNARLYSVGTDVEDVIILDLSVSPENPTLLKQIDLGQGYVHDLFVRDNVAYCSHIYTKKLFVYDFTDVDNPSILGSLTSYSNKGLNHSNWVSENGNVLVLADETKNKAVKVVDVSDLSDIKEITTFKSTLEGPNYTNSIPHNPFIYGNDYVFVSYYHDGVQLYDISDPENPFKSAYFDTDTLNANYNGSRGCWGVYPYLPSGNIIASDMRNGLFVIRTTFPLEDCEDEINISGAYDNDWDFSANSNIVSNATIEANGKMVFRAPNRVELNPGFESENGSVLELLLDDACEDAPTAVASVDNGEFLATSIEVETAKHIFQVSHHPNPFQNVAYIEYKIPHANMDVELEVYNTSGQKIQTLVSTKKHKSGKFKMMLGGDDLTTGIYYYTFRAGNYTFRSKIIKE
ncbi:MAG: choice-of-anchor B family protein [Chitinophagales bacterium]